jgi:hypothetical protein
MRTFEAIDRITQKIAGAKTNFGFNVTAIPPLNPSISKDEQVSCHPFPYEFLHCVQLEDTQVEFAAFAVNSVTVAALPQLHSG